MMKWGDIKGQTVAKRILERYSKRPPNAYLFFGPSGVGKSLIAKTYAKILNCERRSSSFFECCDECSSCYKIERNAHPDVKHIKPKSDLILVSQISELLMEVRLKPFLGRKRVCIVEECEKMSNEAANSILKVLEEPPLDTLFILITIDPSSLLPTIKSRCSLVRFNPLPKVSKIDKEKKIKILNLLRKVYGGGILEVFKVADELAASKDELQNFLDILLNLYHTSLLVKEYHHSEFSNEAPLLKLSSRELEGGIEAIQECKDHLLQNANAKLSFEVMLFKILDLKEEGMCLK